MPSVYTIQPKKTSVFPTCEKTLCVNPLAAPARAVEDCPQDDHVLPGVVPEVGGTSYLDHIASLEKWDGDRIICGRYAIIGSCSDNGCHTVGRVIYCGREWCPTCGKVKSEAHRRRYGRLVPKAQQMPVVGMLTLTWPVELRLDMRNQDALRKASRAAKKVMKELGYERGVHRWHFFGDKSTKYHPHLMLLIDEGKITKHKLSAIKEKLRATTGAGVIHYKFVSKPQKIMHMLRYVTRATFLSVRWDIGLAGNLKGFINVGYWGIKTVRSEGHWNRPAVWSFDDLSDDRKDSEEIKNIIAGKCPLCGGKITWQKEIFDTRTRPQAHYTIYGDSYFVLQEHVFDAA